MPTAGGAEVGGLSREGWIAHADGLFTVNTFLNHFKAPAAEADLDDDGAVEFNDSLAFLTLFNAGC